jgi:outer membrane protein OmpA-like peptidoglycan-associated protein
MGMKSRLFASAAFPLLSLSLVMQPAHAFAATAISQSGTLPQARVAGSFEVAQDAPSEEELLKKRKQQKQEPAEQQPAQAPQRQEKPAQAEAPEPKPEKQKQPEAEQAAPQAEPEQPKKQRAPKVEEAAPQQAAPQAEPEQPKKQRAPKVEEAAPQQEQAAPEQPAEGQEKPRHNKRDKQPQQEEAAPQQAAPQAEPEQPKKQRPPKVEEAAPQQQEAQPQTQEAQPDQQRPKDRKHDKQPVAEGEQQPVKPKPGKKPAVEETPQAEPTQQKQPAAEQAPAAQETLAPQKAPTPQESPAPEKAIKPQEKPKTQESATPEKAPVPEQQPAAEGQPAQQGEQTPAVKPNGAATAEQPAANTQQTEQAIPAPEKVTPKELERRKQIAADPSKSTETVVLPVENGAAVLDSDKDADRSGGRNGRRDRDRQRDQEQIIKAPTSDADAQLAPDGKRQPPIKMEAVTSEKGTLLDQRPQFDRPDGARIDQSTDDHRVVLQFNNQTIVRSDDDSRFLRDGERPRYEQLSRDRYRETIERPEGYQIVTVRNRYGDIIQRSRIDNRGRESVLYYSPELYDDPDQSYFEDPGADLPPMRLRIPLRDYIIDTSGDQDRDYYEFLSEPPVEPVERVYSLNEVKYSARIRDKVRRIDLDTITFATGSAEIPMSQARSLRKVADAMNEVLRKDASETFLIEGHTDAVGSEQSNLVLSDQRAESVANVLTDVYGVPPENLATQGYGERYLKVNTDGPEQENRRVTIRRVTALVRPVASRN